MVQVFQKHTIRILVCTTAVALGGCFDLMGKSVDEDASSRTGSGFVDPLPVTTTNTPPTISGTPSTVAIVGNSWSFTPNASDSDGDDLRFTIDNKPMWSDFNEVNGRLSGVPQLGNEGSYERIRISANDGESSVALPEFNIMVRSVNSNTAPTISGTPSISATAGQAYLFVPSASDIDGDRLTFEIANQPAWTTFDSTTGQLSGTPQQGDSALYENIVISVRDNELMTSLPAFVINVSQVATSSVTLNWTPPTQNEDGTPLTDLIAYKIYYGLTEGNYPNEIRIDNPGITTYVVDNLTPNMYYFVSTSINASEIESDFSNVASKLVN